LNKSIDIVSNKGIKCPEEIDILMLASTYVPGDVKQNSIGTFPEVAGNSVVFEVANSNPGETRCS